MQNRSRGLLLKPIFILDTKTCTSSSIAENSGYAVNMHSSHWKEKNNSKAACIIIQAVFVCTKMHKISVNIMTIKQKCIKIKKERGMSIQWQHKSLIHYRLRKP